MHHRTARGGGPPAIAASLARPPSMIRPMPGMRGRSMDQSLVKTPQVAQARRRDLRHWLLRRVSGQAGMATAEYAVATVAACGFGGLLYKLLTGLSTKQIVSSLNKFKTVYMRFVRNWNTGEQRQAAKNVENEKHGEAT